MEKQYLSNQAGMNNYYAGEVPAQPAQPALGSLYEAVKHLNETALLARNTVDRLCGSQPEAIGKDASPNSSSYFGQLEDLAADIRSLAGRIASDMTRVQNRL